MVVAVEWLLAKEVAQRDTTVLNCRHNNTNCTNVQHKTEARSLPHC